MSRFQLCKILLEKGPNHILVVILTSFDICIYVLLLEGKQLRTALESNRYLVDFYRCTTRHNFLPFPSGMGPVATLDDFLHLVVSRLMRHQTSSKALQETLRTFVADVLVLVQYAVLP